MFVILDRAITNKVFKNIRFVATDMDGTLTQNGKFSATLLQALEDLAAAGIGVLIVTGRSAGWVSGLVSYLPVVGAIAENGGIFYPANSDLSLLTPIRNLSKHRQQLELAFQLSKHKFPQIRESSDNSFRLTDWTFDNRDLTLTQLQSLGEMCEPLGWDFTYSSVQCHIKLRSQDKATGLLKVLNDYFPQYSLNEVLTIGDSPNDESFFDANLFPVSVGVANVREYANVLKHQPAYITTASEGEGFCELAQYLLHR